MHGRQDLLRTAFELGVKAYVVKEGAMVDVVDAIRAVREGRPYISSELSAALLTRPPEAAATALPADWQGRLTRAEVRVLRLIAEFKTSKEIGQELEIHYRTVENHRTAIAAKLGLSGSHALTKFAVEHRDRLV
jgi:DNA-binding NarL/FixJ family response regulator